MSGAEESTMSSVARAQACITDCSILNQTSCQPVTRRQLVTSADQVREMSMQSIGLKCRVNSESKTDI